MEQPNQLNNGVNQLKGMLGFLNPSISFIVNAAFGVITFLFFLLSDAGADTSVASVLFDSVGGIFVFLILTAMVLAALLSPMKTFRLCPAANYFVAGFAFLFTLGFMHLEALSVFTLIFSLLWMVFTLLKKDDEIKF